MAKKKKKARELLHHLREWREFRKMSQEQLAGAVGTDKSVISLLESGSRGLSDKWARRLAPALKIKAGWLLDYSPDDFPGDLLDTWGGVPIELHGQALKTLESFKKAAR